MKKYADKGRRPLEFQVGDKVLLKLTPQIWKKFISESVHQGLIPKYDGPFEIVKRVSAVAYKLKLPERLQIHPTVHIARTANTTKLKQRERNNDAPKVVAPH